MGISDAEFKSDQAEWPELNSKAVALDQELSIEMNRAIGRGDVLLSQLQAKYPHW